VLQLDETGNLASSGLDGVQRVSTEVSDCKDVELALEIQISHESIGIHSLRCSWCQLHLLVDRCAHCSRKRLCYTCNEVDSKLAFPHNYSMQCKSTVFGSTMSRSTRLPILRRCVFHEETNCLTPLTKGVHKRFEVIGGFMSNRARYDCDPVLPAQVWNSLQRQSDEEEACDLVQTRTLTMLSLVKFVIRDSISG